MCVGRAGVLYYTWIWTALFMWGKLWFYNIPEYGMLYVWGELRFYNVPGYEQLYLCGESSTFIIYLDMECCMYLGRAEVLYYTGTWIWTALFMWGELRFYNMSGNGQLYFCGEAEVL